MRGRRRRGTNEITVAHSAPIYVVVDDEPTWNPDALPDIVGELRMQLRRMPHEEIPPIVDAGPETWETRALAAEQWLRQRPLLKPRLERAEAAYLELIAELERFHGAGSGAAGALAIEREKVEEEHDH